MIKAGKGVILVLLCTLFIFCQTGCARNKESAKAERNTVTVFSNIPDVSASPLPLYSPEPIKTEINENFIFGVDISDIKSEYNSGVKYFDFEGNKLFYDAEEGQKDFCTFLKECGFNWVRIRSRYNTDDWENVKEIGKLASDAGLRVLIEFNYSDFLTDIDMDIDMEEKIETLEEYTVESLIELIDYGVNVCMVQMDNEYMSDMDLTNICILINSGCTAVRYVADTMEKEILVALHFTDIAKSKYETVVATLEENQVDYDIFAASYYTHTDKTAQKFTDVMKVIAEKYEKEVITVVASDVYKVKGKKAAKRQADIVTDMTQSVVSIGEAGVGMFLETALFGAKGHPLKAANVFKDAFAEAVNVAN